MRRGRLARHELAGIPVQAVSVGGLETCITLPSFKIAFDVGLCPPEVVPRDTILFTHSHMDHMGGVVYHTATRALRRMEPPTYVVPPADREAFEALFEAWRPLDRSELPHRTVPLGPGEELDLSPRTFVRPFRALHVAPAQGYVVVSRREKLKEEYLGRSSAELHQLRKESVPITHEVHVPEVAFTGDTRVEVLEREEDVRRARLLVMEVTFLDDRVSVEEAREKGHTHLDEIAARAELFENEAVLFTHFSPRYRRDEIRELLKEKLPPSLARKAHPLLAGF